MAGAVASRGAGQLVVDLHSKDWPRSNTTVATDVWHPWLEMERVRLGLQCNCSCSSFWALNCVVPDMRGCKLELVVHRGCIYCMLNCIN